MEFLNKLKTREEKFSTLSTAIICMMGMLVITFWSYESHVPIAFMSILRKIAIAAAVIMWLYASFMRGLVKRTAFAVFTAFYFILPTFIVQAADKAEANPQTLDMNLMFAGDWARLIGVRPFENMPVFRDMETLTASVIFSSVCLIVFLGGMFIGNIKSKEQEKEKEQQSD